MEGQESAAEQFMRENGGSDTSTSGAAGSGGVQKTAAELEAERIAAAGGSGGGLQKTAEELEAERIAQESRQGAAAPEINDEAVRAYLKKNKGIELDDIDDLAEKLKKKDEKPLTEDEQKAADEKFRQDALTFAVTNTKVKPDTIAAFGKDSQRSPEEIVYAELKTTWLAADPTLTEEDAKSRFRDYFKLDEPEDSWMRKERAHELNARASDYFKGKYPEIVKATDNYSQHLTALSEAADYNKRVTRVFDKKVPAEISIPIEFTKTDGGKESVPYSFKFNTEAIEEVRKSFLSPETFGSSKDMSEDDMQRAVVMALKEKHFDKIVSSIAIAHGARIAKEVKAGRFEIPAQEQVGSSQQQMPGTGKLSLAEEFMNQHDKK